MVLGPCLVTDDRKGFEHGGFVEGGSQGNGLGKNRGQPGPGYAVKRFVPPVVHGNAQPVDGRGLVHHLHDFLLQGQSAQQIIDPFLR